MIELPYYFVKKLPLIFYSSNISSYHLSALEAFQVPPSTPPPPVILSSRELHVLTLLKVLSSKWRLKMNLTQSITDDNITLSNNNINNNNNNNNNNNKNNVLLSIAHFHKRPNSTLHAI